MMLRTPATLLDLPVPAYAARHDRYFMEIGRELVVVLPAATTGVRIRFVPFQEKYMEDLAHLLAASYRGHVDSEINDQYRGIPGARQFLSNIVRFPGCGRFASTASVLAIDENTGRVCGMCLTSNISQEAGHITQVCVVPGLRGARVGYELLRRALRTLVDNGSSSVSLTVTCSNADAIRLYKSLGFRVIATFPALVWDRSS
jgi:ribosomal protein S18 acetylase RimI-like enzyme